MQTIQQAFGLRFAQILLPFVRVIGTEAALPVLFAMEGEKSSSDQEADDEEESSEGSKKSGKKDSFGKNEDTEDNEDEGGKKKDEKDKKNDNPKKPPPYKRPVVVISVSIVLLIAIVGGLIYWLHARHFVSTDDAYVDGHVVQIASQVPAPVVALHVDDNQLVRKGDLLIELDPTDYQVALEQAQAQRASSQGRLAQAQAQLESAKASVTEALAEVDAAQVALDNATRDLQRYEAVDERARSRQQLDNAVTAQKNAQAQLEQAKAKKVSADASVSTTAASIKAAEGDTRTAEANVKRAEVNQGYCKIYAPADGRVTQRTVEVGNYVQTGATLFMLVSPEVWITANFKETQLVHMRPGQPVTIKVDAFPDLKLNGRVDSIQAGSGSRFGVLPPENATGNFVKIVQRVPVKIVLDYSGNTNNADLLSPGLSVTPKVRVR
ncbi:MAG TPA: HlyD family secretion protein [Verrucomicrobiae bacterium]|jgi:membrane fusion protein (multidrug efflux system)|nr:HlyD family secretion protein [Verrucomicrobiae bacterium]